MGTYNQLIKKYRLKTFSFKKRNKKTPALKKTIRTVFGRGILNTYVISKGSNPQKAGKCKKIYILTPKKPNSAQRKVAKVELSNGKLVSCYISGSSQTHGMDANARVLIRGGRVQDLPGVHYKIIRGKLDCKPDFLKANARSKYGVKRGKTNRELNWKYK